MPPATRISVHLKRTNRKVLLAVLRLQAEHQVLMLRLRSSADLVGPSSPLSISRLFENILCEHITVLLEL